MTEQRPSIKEVVFTAIENKKTVMRPRWHFILRSVLVVLGIAFGFFFALYLGNLTIFLLNDSGLIFVPAFGFVGVLEFLTSAPWLLLFGAIVLVVISEVLVRRFSFAYRKPLLYSLGMITAVVIFGSVAVYAMVPSDVIERIAEGSGYFEHRHMMRSLGFQPPPNVHRGVIVMITEDELVIERRGVRKKIIVTSSTRFPDGVNLVVGDRVIVLGKPTGTSSVEAMGVLLRVGGDQRLLRREQGWRQFQMHDGGVSP